MTILESNLTTFEVSNIVFARLCHLGSCLKLNYHTQLNVTKLVEHPGVPWKGSRGVANFWTKRLYTRKLESGVPLNCSIKKEGCRESKEVEKHCGRTKTFFSFHFFFSCFSFYITLGKRFPTSDHVPPNIKIKIRVPPKSR